jgi:hypothetical protein
MWSPSVNREKEVVVGGDDVSKDRTEPKFAGSGEKLEITPAATNFILHGDLRCKKKKSVKCYARSFGFCLPSKKETPDRQRERLIGPGKFPVVCYLEVDSSSCLKINSSSRLKINSSSIIIVSSIINTRINLFVLFF